jgi:hypothetical protein
MPTPSLQSQVKTLTERVRQLERANVQLVHHANAWEALVHQMTKLLDTAITERNYFYRKMMGSGKDN